MQLLMGENQAVIRFAKALDTQSLIDKDLLANLDLTGGKITTQDIGALGTVDAKATEGKTTVTSPKI